jgi:predicted dehydrogenase
LGSDLSDGFTPGRTQASRTTTTRFLSGQGSEWSAHKETAERAASITGARGVTDYREITENPDIDIVHICSPNNLHAEQLRSALENGKHVYCDKPLTATLDEALSLIPVLSGTTRKLGMTFQVRFFPAVIRARQLMEKGTLGRVLNFRAAYLHGGSADPDAPAKWKLLRASGGGVIADLSSHVIDLLSYLGIQCSSLHADSSVAFAERPSPENSQARIRADAEDHVVATARCSHTVPHDTTDTTCLGTIEATKVASGTEDELRLEIHGTRGAIRFNSMEPHKLDYFDASQPDTPVGGFRGWTRIETGQRYPAPAASFPGPKHAIGWIRSHLACLAGFMDAVYRNTEPIPGWRDGLYVQTVLEALRQSCASGERVDIPEA